MKSLPSKEKSATNQTIDCFSSFQILNQTVELMRTHSAKQKQSFRMDGFTFSRHVSSFCESIIQSTILVELKTHSNNKFSPFLANRVQSVTQRIHVFLSRVWRYSLPLSTNQLSSQQYLCQMRFLRVTQRLHVFLSRVCR